MKDGLELCRLRLWMLGGGASEPVESLLPWRVYFPGPARNPEAAELFRQISEMALEDRRAALRGLRKLVQHAAAGRDPAAAYPTRCHEAFGFSHHGQAYKVWRIREGDLRIYFFYSADRLLLLPHVGEKREDRLREAQCSRIAAPVRRFLDALAVGAIRYEEYEE